MSLWVITTCLGLLPGNQTTAMLVTIPTTASTATMTTEQPATTGSLRIVSRLGTTLAPYAMKNMTSFNADSVQVSSYNTAVKVLRPNRIPYRKNMTSTYNNVRKTNDTQNIIKAQSGACVPAGTCIRNRIDVRIVTPQVPCTTGQEYCGGTSTRNDLSNINCGVIQPVSPSPVILEPGQASFGAIPWQGALLASTEFVTGIVLIDSLNVLTVAHKVSPYLISDLPDNLIVRLGDWVKVLKDPVSYQEYTVLKVFSHPMYNPSTLENDIAILRLASRVPFTPSAGAAVSINRACLPLSSSTAYTERRCIVSNRGYQMLGPKAFFKEIRKKVDVSIVDSETCQSLLRITRLGSELNVQSSSFICARGEDDEDACTEDGGSGLLCEVDGKWQIVGLYTRGLGCGIAKMPGVYVNVATFLTWIQEKIASS
ncbi:unnamed protein product [Arctia plantaginis]|uniref:Peptidase S1 domain-containing protein n=1 Tax=Arctia plantaginis TaxID=874455 RepID=A0A8S1A085_ARCPL|nr:unnamed protein product [Arctia plantaginis]